MERMERGSIKELEFFRRALKRAKSLLYTDVFLAEQAKLNGNKNWKRLEERYESVIPMLSIFCEFKEIEEILEEAKAAAKGYARRED